jgi:hypothetical protein
MFILREAKKVRNDFKVGTSLQEASERKFLNKRKYPMSYLEKMKYWLTHKNIPNTILQNVLGITVSNVLRNHVDLLLFFTEVNEMSMGLPD